MTLVVICVWFLWGHAVVAKNHIETVWCVNDDITSQHNLMKIMRKEDILCKAEQIENYPFTLEQLETPPKPESINVTYRTYQANYQKDNGSVFNVTTTEIVVVVSWTYKIQYFEKVESYHIEVNYFKPPGSPKQYLMIWNSTLKSLLQDSGSRFVTFNFLYCGKPNNFHIHPKDMYRFRIQPCPIYHEVNDPQTVAQILRIPGCENETISKVQRCACKEGYTRRHGRCRRPKKTPQLASSVAVNTTTVVSTSVTLGMSKEKPKKSSTRLVLLGVGIFLIILLMIFAFCGYRERKALRGCCVGGLKETTSPEKRHVLLICSLENRYSEPMTNLINIFSKFPHLEVKSNLRRKNEIGEFGIHEWTKNQVSDADIVVFLIAGKTDVFSDDKKENESALLNDVNHQVGLVLKATEKIIVNNKADNTDKKFIIVDMETSTKRELPYFKHCKLPSEFNKFARIVTGGKGYVKEKDKKIFLLSLSIAQLGGYNNRTASEDKFQKTVIEDVPEPSNDLDFGAQHSNDISLDVINITGTDGFESYSRSSTQPYSSIDTNGDSSWQYCKSGARPKQSC